MPLSTPPPIAHYEAVQFTLARQGQVYRVSDARRVLVTRPPAPSVALDTELADDAALVATELVGADLPVEAVYGSLTADGAVEVVALLANTSQ